MALSGFGFRHSFGLRYSGFGFALPIPLNTWRTPKRLAGRVRVSGCRLIRAVGCLGVQDAFVVEPERVNRQKPVEAVIVVPFLVIGQPELLVGAFHDAMMARPQHTATPVDEWVAWVFHKRAGGRLGRGVADTVVGRVGARAGVG